MKLLADNNDTRIPGTRQFELEGWIDPSPFECLLGLRIEEAAEGHATLSLPFTVKLANGGGVMHGGALTTLADTAVAMAIKTLLPPGSDFATTDLTVKFVAPVTSGTVIAVARAVHKESRTYLGECELRGEQNQVYALFSSVFKTVHKKGKSLAE